MSTGMWRRGYIFNKLLVPRNKITKEAYIMPIEILPGLLFLAFGILYFVIRKYIQYYRNRKIKEMVGWCFLDDGSGQHRSRRLIDYIHNAQIKYNLPADYRISGEDARKQAGIILEAFKDDLLQDYFLDSIAYTKSKYVIPEDHFFMFRLFCFISDYFNDRRSVSLAAIELISRNYTPEIMLTLYKLHYLSYLFCANSPIYKDKIAGWLTTRRFTDAIDELLAKTSK